MKRVALVTGASAGLGKDIVIKLLKEGYTVYGVARRVELMQDIADLGCHIMKMNITSQDDIDHIITHIINTESRIDVLVNNAGYGFYSSLEDSSLDQAQALYDVNVFGLMRITKSVLPTMRQQKSGTIINISSVVGKIAFPFMGWYSSSKHAVEGLSDSLRIELFPFGIKVVLIQPGRVESEFGQVALINSKESTESDYSGNMRFFLDLIERNPGPAAKVHSISNTVLKIVRSRNPKSRYCPNIDGKCAFWAQKWLGQGVIDSFARLILKHTNLILKYIKNI